MVVAIGMASCSETKFVPEGEHLLSRISLRTDSAAADINTSQMKSYVRQRANARWFGAVKVPLATYSLSGRDTTRWLNRLLRSMGESPVLFDTLSAWKTMHDLQMQMQNTGYLSASVDLLTEVRGKKLKATYLLHPGAPYSIGSMDYDIQDTAIARLLAVEEGGLPGLQAGMRFNVENLDRERKRITSQLVNQGYYRFNKDYISYRADSTGGDHQIGLTLVLHQNRNSPDASHLRYRVRSVSYQSGDADDPEIHLRPSVLRSNTFIREGQLFSARDLQNTYTHFGRLGAVRYTSISFTEHPDSQSLDCHIQLSTNKPSTLSFQPEGTNTAGDLGAAASLIYQNRNLFRGSENLSIQLRGAFEAIKGLEGYANDNFVEYSAETRLTFPRFIAPFLSNSFRRRINATSEVSLLYDLQNRPEFHRRVFSVGWRYKWNDQNHHDRYQIDLLDLNYISMPWISETFRREYLDDTSSRNAILRYNYEDLFIMKWGFGYSYNNGRYAIKVNAETAGNLLNLASRVVAFPTNGMGQHEVIGIAYAQYAKADADFTRNFQFDYQNQLVFHVGLGIAYPYGNSTVLPFEKRYFAGGANSVRGWSVRNLGPGRFISRDGRIDFINQTGDMKLDLNLEYRAHLFWKLGGALFVDAGNIWTLRNYADQPGGQFRLTEFWRQMAVSYGMGFRFNFDYFILRFDLGMKAINPAYEDSRQHFPIIHPRMSRDFAFHFAVGLPF